MFQALITKPFFNLLIVILVFTPNHDFGLALIVTTILIRLALWPLLKRQLHSQKAMRELQPEIAKIKKKVKGDKQKEAELMMELYKEKKINPLSGIGLSFLQMPIIIGLYFVIKDAVSGAGFGSLAYGWVKDLPYVADIIANPDHFHPGLLNLVDLSKHPLINSGGHQTIYWPAMILLVIAAAAQFIQSKQLMGNNKDGKSLKDLFSDATKGKTAEPADKASAFSGGLAYLSPVLMMVVGVNFPSGLALYWAVSSTVAALQQRSVLNQDVKEMATSDVKVTTVVTEGATKKKPKARAKKGNK